MKNMRQIMKQAQKMQAEMAKVQAALADKMVEASAGGGAVKVVANGHKVLQEVVIDPSVVDPDDVEMLQDLILVTVNDALHKADEMAAADMEKFSGGMNLPF